VSLTAASSAAAWLSASRTFIEMGEPFCLVLRDQGGDNLFKPRPLQYLLEPVQRQIDPVVGHPPLGKL
jgi:hypothetical protein